MIGKFLVVAAGMLLTAQVACADEMDDCQANCGNKLRDCIAGIDKPNDIEVQELRQQCEDRRSECNHFCDGRAEDPYKEEKEKAAREKQESDHNGGKPIEIQFDK